VARFIRFDFTDEYTDNFFCATKKSELRLNGSIFALREKLSDMSRHCWMVLMWPLVLLLSGYKGAAQTEAKDAKAGTYFFEGEDVVFEFDLRQYQTLRRAESGIDLDFAEMDIDKVAISGNFNNWSSEGWTMVKIDNYRFRLRKKVTALEGFPNWQFRYVINGDYFLSPEAMLKKTGALAWSVGQTSQAAPDSGNVVFQLAGFPDAKEVIVTGSFNSWDEKALTMRRTDNRWERRLSLRSGEYEYKFIVDGKWMHDPANPRKRINEYANFNSVLSVQKSVIFTLDGFPDAHEVLLAGDFTNWQNKALPMYRQNNRWTVEVPLEGGKKYYYKFIIDGEWITDPANPRIEMDKKGNLNTVLLVR
jgi:Glycogen recognition site of AMP-activated protein kinase/Carbohydrate-binding module 48 (Isoamylase N-terminal domain)